MELLSVYVSFGFDPDGFWHITPKEMAARIEGARRRLEAEQDGRAWLAWHIAALTRAEKLPDLSKLMTTKKPQPQSADEQTIALDQMFLTWGINPDEMAKIVAARGD